MHSVACVSLNIKPVVGEEKKKTKPIFNAHTHHKLFFSLSIVILKSLRWLCWGVHMFLFIVYIQRAAAALFSVVVLVFAINISITST